MNDRQQLAATPWRNSVETTTTSQSTTVWVARLRVHGEGVASIFKNSTALHDYLGEKLIRQDCKFLNFPRKMRDIYLRVCSRWIGRHHLGKCTAPVLFEVCQQITSEATNVDYAKNLFHLSSSDSFCQAASGFIKPVSGMYKSSKSSRSSVRLARSLSWISWGMRSMCGCAQGRGPCLNRRRKTKVAQGGAGLIHWAECLQRCDAVPRYVYRSRYSPQNPFKSFVWYACGNSYPDKGHTPSSEWMWFEGTRIEFWTVRLRMLLVEHSSNICGRVAASSVLALQQTLVHPSHVFLAPLSKGRREPIQL